MDVINYENYEKHYFIDDKNLVTKSNIYLDRKALKK